MELKCKEVLKAVNDPPSLLKLAIVQWINHRKYWNPDLALHLCERNPQINDIIFDCDVTNRHGRILYEYQSLRDIIMWEANNKGRMAYRPRWLSKNMKRDHVIVKLRDEIEMAPKPPKRVRRRLPTEEKWKPIKAQWHIDH